MSKAHSEEYNAISVLVDLQKQTHSCVKELSRDVKRNTALTVANGVKLETVIKESKDNNNRLDGVELWQAGHMGEAKGKEHRETRFTSRTTLICVIGGTLLTLLGLWFSFVQPALNANADLIQEVQKIEATINSHRDISN